MSTSASTEVVAAAVWFDDRRLWVRLNDGREIGVPIGFFPRMLHATPVQRANPRLIGGGIGIHWPEIDEDISVRGLLEPGGDASLLGQQHHADREDCRRSREVTDA